MVAHELLQREGIAIPEWSPHQDRIGPWTGPDGPRYAITSWRSNGEEPGLLVVQKWGSSDHRGAPGHIYFNEIARIRTLGVVGMQPALDAVGVNIDMVAVENFKDEPPSTLATMTIPATDPFCEGANRFLQDTHPTDRTDDGPLRFEAYEDGGRCKYPMLTGLEKISDRTVLIANHPVLGEHDIITHGLGYLSFEPSIFSIPVGLAQNSLKPHGPPHADIRTYLPRVVADRIESGVSVYSVLRVMTGGVRESNLEDLLGSQGRIPEEECTRRMAEHILTTPGRAAIAGYDV
ncbi:MAG TPA: hypothetical protein VLH38_04450 [Patescibacteria group bacterium]|nr:hypothetical protein [Patescibacteria group bacterium]